MVSGPHGALAGTGAHAASRGCLSQPAALLGHGPWHGEGGGGTACPHPTPAPPKLHPAHSNTDLITPPSPPPHAEPGNAGRAGAGGCASPERTLQSGSRVRPACSRAAGGGHPSLGTRSRPDAPRLPSLHPPPPASPDLEARSGPFLSRPVRLGYFSVPRHRLHACMFAPDTRVGGEGLKGWGQRAFTFVPTS